MFSSSFFFPFSYTYQKSISFFFRNVWCILGGKKGWVLILVEYDYSTIIIIYWEKWEQYEKRNNQNGCSLIRTNYYRAKASPVGRRLKAPVLSKFDRSKFIALWRKKLYSCCYEKLCRRQTCNFPSLERNGLIRMHVWMRKIGDWNQKTFSKRPSFDCFRFSLEWIVRWFSGNCKVRW